MDKSISIEEIISIFSQSNIFFLMTDREGNILSHTYNVPERIKREKCVIGLDEILTKPLESSSTVSKEPLNKS